MSADVKAHAEETARNANNGPHIDPEEHKNKLASKDALSSGSDKAEKSMPLPTLVPQDSTDSSLSRKTSFTGSTSLEEAQKAKAAEESQTQPMGAPIGLVRQFTMGGYEFEGEGIESPELVDPVPLQRQDTFGNGFVPPDANGSASRKRPLIAPEALLKRQETMDLGGSLQRQDTLASEGLKTASLKLSRVHSLVGPDTDDMSRPASAQWPPFLDTGVNGSRLSPTVPNGSIDSLFSPPPAALSGTLLKGSPVERQSSTMTDQTPGSPLVVHSGKGENSASQKAPVPITRQESWTEDVSDAGWRAW